MGKTTMDLDWAPLREELSKWRSKDLRVPVWWRDDDAIRPTEALEQLTALSDEVEIPVHLAIIPRNAVPALADYVKEQPRLVPVVHGWSHTNHQRDEPTKGEFGENRPLADRKEEVGEGLRRLAAWFGDQTVPMFVPPWNRLPESFYQELPALGYKSLSTCHPREAVEAAPGLTQYNIHIDPLYWRPSRQLSEPQLIIEKTVRLLKQRRQEKADNTEPLGLLTHHLAHKPKVWEFCRQFWLELREGPIDVFEHP